MTRAFVVVGATGAGKGLDALFLSVRKRLTLLV